ncbi:MAG TPA: flavodoxin family protein [Spirochaetota bacterium]|nr:flavodoxin family protein [Spirochaetota bacterium]HPR36901.1 flavodoxin family protein [Spirochaetota bacterium]
MLLLSIFGSPRKNGFSSRLHEELIIPFKDRGFFIERVYAYDAEVRPCTGCGWCSEHRDCCIDDEMTGIYNLLRTADIISISTPLYFSSFPSPLKAIMDRCQLLWEEGRRGKGTLKPGKGLFICAAGDEYRGMFDGVSMGIRHFYNAVNTSYNPDDAILYPLSDSSSEISLEFIEKARTIGERYSAL